MRLVPANSIIIYNADSKFKQFAKTIKHLVTGKPIKENYVIQYIVEDTYIDDSVDNVVYYQFTNRSKCKFNLQPSKILKRDFKNFRNDKVLNFISISNGDVESSYAIDTDYNTTICLIEYSGNWQRSII